MTIRRTVAALTLMTLVAVPTVLLAGGPHGKDGGRGHGRMHRGPGGPGAMMGLSQRALRSLDLSDVQKGQIEAILEQARPAAQELRRQMGEAREDYLSSQASGVFDEDRARAFTASQAGMVEEMMFAALRTRSEVLAVLTPEQLAQLEDQRQQRRERGRKMRDCLEEGKS